jgi:outer membrane protein assembly factor BamB
MHRFLAASCLTLTLSLTLGAADWPQFLGAHRDGTTPEVVTPWTGDLKVLWKKPVGESHSSPVVVDGLVYAFYQPKGKDADALAAFDAKTGEMKWEKSYERAKFEPLFGNGPRSTPVVSGGKVFTLGGTGILACWDAKNGDISWKVDTLKEFNAKNLFFGVSTSPIMIGADKVAIMVGGKGAGVVAFNVKDGSTAWKATDDPSSYASPVLVNKQLITLTGANLLGLSETGEKLWAFPFKDRLNESSTTPVVAGDLVVGSSVTAGTVVLKVAEKDGKFTPEKVWDDKKLNCYFSTPVVVGEHLYMVNSAGQLTKPIIVIRCVELKTGKVLWEKPTGARYHAAIVRCGAPGQETLLTLDDNGFLSLFEPNGKDYKELARSKVCGRTWAHHAVVDGHVYLRDDDALICIPLPK